MYVALLAGCATPHGPQPQDTKLDPDRRNWTQIYEKEIKIAIENQDYEAYYFFVQELVKDAYREEYGKEMDPNPSLKFLK